MGAAQAAPDWCGLIIHSTVLMHAGSDRNRSYQRTMAVGVGLFGLFLLLSQQTVRAGERRLTPSELLDCYHQMDTSLGIYYNS